MEKPRHKNDAQIDLLIERKDQVVNLCEMKYSTSEFVINKDYENNLRNKISSFISETKTKNSINLTMITTYGLKHNQYSEIVQNEIVMDDLFG